MQTEHELIRVNENVVMADFKPRHIHTALAMQLFSNYDERFFELFFVLNNYCWRFIDFRIIEKSYVEGRLTTLI